MPFRSTAAVRTILLSLLSQSTKFAWCLLLILCAADPIAAQTTGSLSGTIADASRAVLPGVTVVATHVPTSTTYETVTDSAGNFTILNVRVGGPYSVTARLTGFKEVKQDDLFVKLGSETAVPFQLELATVTETVTVLGSEQCANQSKSYRCRRESLSGNDGDVAVGQPQHQ